MRHDIEVNKQVTEVIQQLRVVTKNGRKPTEEEIYSAVSKASQRIRTTTQKRNAVRRKQREKKRRLSLAEQRSTAPAKKQLMDSAGTPVSTAVSNRKSCSWTHSKPKPSKSSVQISASSFPSVNVAKTIFPSYVFDNSSPQVNQGTSTSFSAPSGNSSEPRSRSQRRNLAKKRAKEAIKVEIAAYRAASNRNNSRF